MYKVDREGNCIARTSPEEVRIQKEKRIPVNSTWFDDMEKITTNRREICLAK